MPFNAKTLFVRVSNLKSQRLQRTFFSHFNLFFLEFCGLRRSSVGFSEGSLINGGPLLNILSKCLNDRNFYLFFKIAIETRSPEERENRCYFILSFSFSLFSPHLSISPFFLLFLRISYSLSFLFSLCTCHFLFLLPSQLELILISAIK